MTGDSTRSVHEAEPLDPQTGSVTTPIYETSTFGFKKAGDVPIAVGGFGEKGYTYSRWENPTVVNLERKLAAFEHGAEGAAFSSGMAAISTSVFAFLKKGAHVLGIRDLYGGTYALLHDILPEIGFDTDLVDTSDFGALERGVKKNTGIVYVESPTNPTLKVVDIARAARVARKNGAVLMVDNTFASPVNQNPLDLGADIVLHSVTKYINGHADLIAGAAVASKAATRKIKMMRRDFGGTLDPFPAWLILRGMKTMAIRVRQQNSSAMALAEFLSTHRKVKAVHYPGLKTHPQHALAKKQMKGFGGMLSFEIRGTTGDAMRFTESCRVATLAASLGGVETLVSQPYNMTHAQMSAKERAVTGIPETLVRVSVGVEDVEDLVADFKQALAAV
ncbi:MAG: aminotransferase class I/II-fold pyridoxal phosphate-dependent enzyme [Nitrososphaerota archaeon]|nr:aminotransferase class I/II-fold pyridoxal phosphate-dependent enzyme [Nitrososphaerota archaeon]MDG7024778.1 aminotransferase class I/II-fold pyridoxal phosphate-dependent enzyme [Nitrososphaerota archaeon]